METIFKNLYSEQKQNRSQLELAFLDAQKEEIQLSPVAEATQDFYGVMRTLFDM